MTLVEAALRAAAAGGAWPAALRLLRDARGQAAEERAQAAARPPKQRPNDLCRCGSGKKHKKCCMNKRGV